MGKKRKRGKNNINDLFFCLHRAVFGVYIHYLTYSKRNEIAQMKALIQPPFSPSGEGRNKKYNSGTFWAKFYKERSEVSPLLLQQRIARRRRREIHREGEYTRKP